MSRRGLLAGAAALPVLAAGPAAGARQRPHRVLVFTKTNGYRHASIPLAISTITRLGSEHGFEVVATERATAFNDRDLRGYTAIVFVNTVGNVLTDPARAAIRRFVLDGGGWVGVHAAADTEYDWPFYTRLLSGGRFLCHPLLEQPGVIVRESQDHRSTKHLPRRWQVALEEFYSFTRNVRGDADVLLSIDEETYDQDPNTSQIPSGPAPPANPGTGTMGDHPICWQRRIGRGLSWYTALGHEVTMYLDPQYRQHLLGGLLTATRHGQRNLPA